MRYIIFDVHLSFLLYLHQKSVSIGDERAQSQHNLQPQHNSRPSVIFSAQQLGPIASRPPLHPTSTPHYASRVTRITAAFMGSLE